ncbi:hypothetical protein TNCV_153491 [Trichonephila clavipes]|nr:hypothetical protein TNCV_153491 [Trichonephila clavipes]
MVDAVGPPDQELQNGFALSSNNRTLHLKSSGTSFRIPSFDFDRVSQYRVALMVPTSKKSRNKTPCVSPKTTRSTLSAEGVVLNFFPTDDDGCGLRFGSEMVDPRFILHHNPSQKVIAIFMVRHEMSQANHHALFHVCRGKLSGYRADTFLCPRMLLMIL